jgi:hypothetical protein
VAEAEEWTTEGLLSAAQRRALHLEARDFYSDGPAFPAWLAGEPFDRAPMDAYWSDLLAPLVQRGVDLRRARIVSEPVSAYIRFEHHVTPKANIAAGEAVRWLPRSLASEIALPGNDFWLIDDAAVFAHFSGGGVHVGSARSTDPAVIELCETAFEQVWQRAIDHSDYCPE